MTDLIVFYENENHERTQENNEYQTHPTKLSTVELKAK